MKEDNSENLPPRDTIDGKKHPIVRRRYTLVTPMMEAMEAEMIRWLSNGTTGAIIIGDKRIGKSRLKRFLAQAMATYFGRLPVYTLTARKYDYSREHVFFGDLLRGFKHPLHDVGTSAQRRDRLLDSVAGIAQGAGESRVVLFIDQAHNLMELQYEWLVDFFDELDERGVELFVFLFGQTELATICDELRRARKNHILGRFMIDRIEYHGVRSHRELKACLVAYDEKSCYPEGTNWTFSRYYFPAAFEQGWRLANYSRELWKAFEEVSRHTNPGTKPEVTMQHFARTVEQLLITRQSLTDTPTLDYQDLLKLVVDNLISPGARDDAPPDEDEEDEQEKPNDD